MYICDKHGSEQDSYYPQCMTAFETRRDAKTMTGEERAAEFEWWDGEMPKGIQFRNCWFYDNEAQTFSVELPADAQQPAERA